MQGRSERSGDTRQVHLPGGDIQVAGADVHPGRGHVANRELQRRRVRPRAGTERGRNPSAGQRGQCRASGGVARLCLPLEALPDLQRRRQHQRGDAAGSRGYGRAVGDVPGDGTGTAGEELRRQRAAVGIADTDRHFGPLRVSAQRRRARHRWGRREGNVSRCYDHRRGDGPNGEHAKATEHVEPPFSTPPLAMTSAGGAVRSDLPVDGRRAGCKSSGAERSISQSQCFTEPLQPRADYVGIWAFSPGVRTVSLPGIANALKPPLISHRA
jgi:hypothetical protein